MAALKKWAHSRGQGATSHICNQPIRYPFKERPTAQRSARAKAGFCRSKAPRKTPPQRGSKGGANQESARSHRALRLAYHRTRGQQFTALRQPESCGIDKLGKATNVPGRQNGV
jgi:hypothetical protein